MWRLLAGIADSAWADAIDTAADHIILLEQALASLPAYARPRPGDPDSPRVVARSDSAGATHTFAQACRDRAVWFSFGFPVDTRIQQILDQVPQHGVRAKTARIER